MTTPIFPPFFHTHYLSLSHTHTHTLSLSLSPPTTQHDSVVVSKVITVPGGSVFVNPSFSSEKEEEVGRYVTVPTRGKPTSAAVADEGIGGLEKEVEELLIKSGSLVEAESYLQ